MAETERLVRVTLLGQEYSFYSAAPEEEMASILRLVREVVESDAAGRPGNLPAAKIAVLACLNIASRYVKLEQEYQTSRKESQTRIARLNEQISRGLLGE